MAEETTMLGECLDSNGNYMRRGFYRDKEGSLIHLDDGTGSWRIGEYVPNGPRLSFCGDEHSSAFATRNLTPVENPLKYFEEYEWIYKIAWTLDDIESILEADKEIAEIQARLEEERRGKNPLRGNRGNVEPRDFWEEMDTPDSAFESQP